jgi:hypothetical protein
VADALTPLAGPVQAEELAAAIDWSRPWLLPYASLQSLLAAAGVANAGPTTAGLLNHCGGAPVRFVAQSALDTGQAYEQFIFETRTVPTRNNLHDFFNGLCWMRFPLAKTRLNALQAAEIASVGIGQVRGPARDGLTLFDENAALLSAPQPLWDALQARDWLRLFVELRPLWVEAQLVLFGHALLEKLVSPRKPITAHVYRVPTAIKLVADMDSWLAEDLSAGKLSGKPFCPLPVLGVPGWWTENENFSFYDDSLVFRPRR